jgi:predicted ATPase/class 3 adenylate cyclase
MGMEGEPMDATPSLPTGTMTFLFTDIEGSTRLWAQQPEAMDPAVSRHFALAAEIVVQHDGIVVKHRLEGDSLFAVFPRALDAVAAAAALQRALHAEPWPAAISLRVRIAVHTGDAVVRDGDYLGAVVNRCARLRSAAHGGQVLLSSVTQELVRGHLSQGLSLRDLGAHRLKDQLEPEHIFQLLHPDLPADFPPLRSLQAFVHNLPRQLTSFIGRDGEMAEIKQLLSKTALLTLTGAGGCGKTRLALQVAADVLEEFEEGVWLVELAALADSTLVPQTVAAALGVREEPGRPLTETLIDYLRPRQVLLLLDNCEHLLSASAQLADTSLRACPRLRVLVTSREGLGIAGETTYRVPSLSLPDLQHLPPVAALSQFEATRLFVDRAAAAVPSFTLNEQNAPSVAEVCYRLDGIPLAIELAAARVKALPVEQITRRLDDRFRLLTGGSRAALPRQQTLRATIDWSYDLLSEAERMLLRRLSVFAGGWTLEAAEAVGAGEGINDDEVQELLTTLVEKSLVLYEEQRGEARYRLLETVRQYSRERLLESGEMQVVCSRHASFYLNFAEQAEPELRRSDQVGWLNRLDVEHDNLRAALEWSLLGDNQGEVGLRLAGALWWFWLVRSHFTEGRNWLDAAVSRAVDAPAPDQVKVLNGAAYLARRVNSSEQRHWPGRRSLRQPNWRTSRERPWLISHWDTWPMPKRTASRRRSTVRGA